VAPLVISEANAAGETKGRSFDHLADLSVNFRSDEDEPELKHIRVAKSWWSRTGDVGQYRVSVTQGGPVRVRDDETAEAEAAARADDWRHSGAVEG
jgi:KaiC/GvpD/RAD55 family RecA-like ATPase